MDDVRLVIITGMSGAGKTQVVSGHGRLRILLCR